MDGNWRDYREGGVPVGNVRGAILDLPPVFRGEVYFEKGSWWAVLNGQRLMGQPNIEHAKACVDWNIWNQLRLIQGGYNCLMARRETWDHSRWK